MAALKFDYRLPMRTRSGLKTELICVHLGKMRVKITSNAGEITEHEYPLDGKSKTSAYFHLENDLEEWTAVKHNAPPPGNKYYVCRENKTYVVAMPCYGMHEPWWVVQTLNGEDQPVKMLETDLWKLVEAF